MYFTKEKTPFKKSVANLNMYVNNYIEKIAKCLLTVLSLSI